MTGEPLSTWECDVVLADGGVVHIRPSRASDDKEVLGLYTRLSDQSRYMRFFSAVSPARATAIDAVTDVDFDRRFALVAETENHIVAIARYDRVGDDAAEVAFSVQEDQQGRGIGTVLLEHLAVIGRSLGVQRFTADVLGQNRAMLGVFGAAGYEVRKVWDSGTAELSFPTDPTPKSDAARDRREHSAEARSLARVLAPRSIAVIGASETMGTIGQVLVRNLLEGGFRGPVYPVNLRATSIAGERAYTSVLLIPGEVDLAVIAVPRDAVLDAARECAAKGVRGLVIISAGFEVGEGRALELELVAIARGSGMRIIGPNCLGVVNTAVDVNMNATFAPFAPTRGRVGFASQSGGLGIGLLGRARELGLGISTFVSMGNKADVSGNDLLQYWEDDTGTDVILLYLESFGNPRKFARLARRIGRRKPIIVLKGGRTGAGARGAQSHTAALASPDASVDAVFRSAGVLRVATLEELYETAMAFSHLPLPAGRRIAIVSNGGGPGILAADACAAAGLEVPVLRASTQAALRSGNQSGAAVGNPIDLVASATPANYAHTLRTVLADDGIDAVLVIFVPPMITDGAAVEQVVSAAASGTSGKPVVACFLNQSGLIEPSSELTGACSVPTFAFPESAVRALGRVADYADWRRRDEGSIPKFDDIDVDSARGLVDEQLRLHPEGVWLDADLGRDLLGAFEIPVVTTRIANSAHDATVVAAEIGLPVVLKARAGSILHKSDVGAVQLGLETPEAVKAAYAVIAAAAGAAFDGVIVQPMAAAGVETIVGIKDDPSFGPIVLFGMGGFGAELMRDTAVRSAPLTDSDAHDIVRELRSSPLMFGYRNSPSADVAALEDLILRIGLLAEQVPEVAELDCNPVVVSATGALVLDVKVRLAPEVGVHHDDRRRMSAAR